MDALMNELKGSGSSGRLPGYASAPDKERL